jgi:hypothetical protein
VVATDRCAGLAGAIVSVRVIGLDGLRVTNDGETVRVVALGAGSIGAITCDEG